MKSIFAHNKNSSGIASLEMILVLVPVILVMFMFINIMLLLGNSMLSQAVVNRGIQQVAALGCMPSELENDLLRGNKYLGVDSIVIDVRTTEGAWNHNSFIDSEGVPTAAARPIPNCSSVNNSNRVGSGDYIYFQMRYNQNVFLGTRSDIDMKSSALTISSTLEGEG